MAQFGFCQRLTEKITEADSTAHFWYKSKSMLRFHKYNKLNLHATFHEISCKSLMEQVYPNLNLFLVVLFTLLFLRSRAIVCHEIPHYSYLQDSCSF